MSGLLHFVAYEPRVADSWLFWGPVLLLLVGASTALLGIAAFGCEYARARLFSRTARIDLWWRS